MSAQFLTKICSDDSTTSESILSIGHSISHQSKIPTSQSTLSIKRGKRESLPMEWWQREDDCRDAKLLHTDMVDSFFEDREDLVLLTSLFEQDICLEPNMFPYLCPPGVLHYTLWSRADLTDREIEDYVDNWIDVHYPHVKRWEFDDNQGERSFLLFHVHVFIETIPYSVTVDESQRYWPPHLAAFLASSQPDSDEFSESFPLSEAGVEEGEGEEEDSRKRKIPSPHEPLSPINDLESPRVDPPQKKVFPTESDQISESNDK